MKGRRRNFNDSNRPYTPDEICEEYLKLKNLTATARKFDINSGTARYWLNKKGVKTFSKVYVRRHDLSKEPLRKIGRIDEIRVLAIKGLTNPEIAKKLSISKFTVIDEIYMAYCSPERFKRKRDLMRKYKNINRKRQIIKDMQKLKLDLENSNNKELPISNRSREIFLRVFNDYF